MKKLIALVLSVLCLVSVCSVAFAGTDLDSSKTVKSIEVGRLRTADDGRGWRHRGPWRRGGSGHLRSGGHARR